MDKRKLTKRLNDLDELIADLTRIDTTRPTEYAAHLASPYYRDALEKSPENLVPVSNVEEYIERLAQYKVHHDETTEYSNRIEPQENRWFQAFDSRIGLIADEFFFKSFEGTADLKFISPTNYRQEIQDLDLLVVSSVWRGLDGSWEGALDRNDSLHNVLFNDVFEFAKKNEIPVAFYSKEDPPNYSTFLPLAKKSDFIFTTSISTVNRYLEDCPDARSINCIPFAVNPLHHNPIGRTSLIDEYAVFAGSWFRHKYGERRAAAAKILDGFAQTDLDLRIYDRNSALQRDRYLFPERFLPYLRSSIGHSESLEVQRRAQWAINLNSVVDSQTMFANRVLELQAMGTPVISNYNAGVNSNFPQVFIPDSSMDLKAFLEFQTPYDLMELSSQGIRNVFENFHAHEAMYKLLQCASLNPVENGQTVTILAESRELCDRFLKTQTYQGSIIHCNLNDLDAIVNSSVVIPVSSSRSYDPNHVTDLINSFKYSASTVTTRIPYHAGLESHWFDFREESIDFYSSAFWMADKNASEVFWNLSSGSGGEVRHLLLPAPNTNFQIQRVTEPADPKLTVVVPVYNNGKHLKYKCFQSLRRSSIFDLMSIILVDDGSTDVETNYILDELSSNYGNVELFRFPEGGSGSASRPRNKGLELARTEFITYLDPDNEALNDGFNELLQALENTDVDFAIGNMVKFSTKRTVVNNYGQLKKHLVVVSEDDSTYAVNTDSLAQINFQPMSIQALVTRTDWLRGLGISQPVGAVGQDSYFFQQMLHYAKRVHLTRTPIHSYYAAVANSTVNSLNPNFYKKYLPLEASRAAWLKEVDLLDEYLARRFEPFLDHWYLSKLRNVRSEERDECVATIVKLLEYYQPGEWSEARVWQRFAEKYKS